MKYLFEVTTDEAIGEGFDDLIDGCPHVDEAEDLVFGALTSAQAVRVRAHLASCAECHAAYEQLVAERSLFERRVVEEPPPPLFLAPDAFEAVSQEEPRRPLIATFAPAFVAAAALIAVVTGITRHGVGAVPANVEAADLGSAATSDTFGEGLSCALPASIARGGSLECSDTVLATASPRLAQRTSPHGEGAEDEQACMSVTDRATCDERVTISVATP